MTSKLASLHAGLVARKGEAVPALTNPQFSYVDAPRPIPSTQPVLAHTPVSAHANEAVAEQRTWASVATHPKKGHTATGEFRAVVRPSPTAVEPARAPVQPMVKLAQTKPAHDTEEANDLYRHRFTFRLTQNQRRRLRLAAAVQDQSLQQVLSSALENHLDGLCACSLQSCACLAAAESKRG